MLCVSVPLIPPPVDLRIQRDLTEEPTKNTERTTERTEKPHPCGIAGFVTQVRVCGKDKRFDDEKSRGGREKVGLLCYC